MQFFMGNPNLQSELLYLFEKKVIYTFKVKWAEQVIVKLMQPN